MRLRVCCDRCGKALLDAPDTVVARPGDDPRGDLTRLCRDCFLLCLTWLSGPKGHEAINPTMTTVQR